VAAAYTYSWLAEACNGTLQQGPATATVTSILVDSRRQFAPQGIAFFALVGERNNGHDYIQSLYDRGVRCFVVSQNVALPAAACVIVVKDTLKALQSCAATHRSNFQLPVVAITGSNGKTVVKEWLYHLLRIHFSVCRSPKSYNSQVGVPLSVWQLKSSHTIGLFEAGISEPNEMEALANTIQPSVGVFTNLGSAHSENFSSPAQKAAEKAKLFTNCNAIVYCADDRFVADAISNLDEPTAVGWSYRTGADIHVSECIVSNGITVLKGAGTLNGKHISFDFNIPFVDKASIENAVHVYLTSCLLGINAEIASKAMATLQPLAMRLQLLEGINGCSIINDVYSADLDALELALDFLDRQTHQKRKTVVLADIHESELNDDALYQKVAELLRSHGVNRFIGIGPKLSKNKKQFSLESVFYNSTEAFLQAVDLSSFQMEAILVKGARAFRFEQISGVLQELAHETVLELDLNALVHNLNHFKRKLHADCKIMAMVKAYGYGTGGHEIANVLEYNLVDYLAVAYADEGISLRKAGIDLDIMVMNPERSAYSTMIQHRLEPEVYSFRVLKEFSESVRRIGAKEPFPIHIKLDTGMHRLGFEEQELPALIEHLAANKWLTVRSVFSHLAASEDPAFDDFTAQQVAALERMVGKLQDALDEPFLVHLLNSAGQERFPNAQMDMVRLGIGMYGISTSEKEFLETVCTLKTSISQIKTVPAGETIGYGRAGKATHEMRIATLAIGYADGFGRNLSNGVGEVFIHGRPAKVVGKVCMDMCMVDVSDNAQAKAGDEVIVFGKNHSIEAFAAAQSTIPYEVLTNISRRVKRVYVEE